MPSRAELVGLLVAICCGCSRQAEADDVLACGEDLRVHQLSFGMMDNFQYLLQSGGRAVTVDAAWDIEGIKKYAQKQGLTLVGGLYTHSHADHIGGSQFGSPRNPGAAELRKAGEGSELLPLWIGAGDLPGAVETCKVKAEAWTPLKEGDVIRPLGNSVQVVVIDTPGHTVGGVSFLLKAPGSKPNGPCGEGLLFTGDTLFVEAAGRTDLPGGDEKTLLRSLSRLTQLPGRTVVLPGHSYGPRPRSSIKKERKGNNFMRQAKQQFPPATLPTLPPIPLEVSGDEL